MARYFITFSYDGAAYHGWQVQPNARTVQQELEAAIATLLRENVPVVGAGRTDTGVNAAKMVAHFDYQKEIDATQMVYKLNRILPNDIVVASVDRVRDDAHARFDALSRRYCYYVATVKNPFSRRYAYLVPFVLDYDAMNRAADILFEYTDFTSFSKLHTDVKTNNCKITYAQWSKVDDVHWVFEIEANRFLRNMVRAIVGTLLLVGRGKLSLEEFRAVIERKERCAAGDSAVAQALFLADVKYPNDIYL